MFLNDMAQFLYKVRFVAELGLESSWQSSEFGLPSFAMHISSLYQGIQSISAVKSQNVWLFIQLLDPKVDIDGGGQVIMMGPCLPLSWSQYYARHPTIYLTS